MKMQSIHTISDQLHAYIHPLYRVNEHFQRLQEEHALLQEGLAELHGMSIAIGRLKETINWSGALKELKAKVIDYQRELDAHAKWEEEILFPMISWYFGEEPEQFDLMDQEHELAKQFIEAFLEATERAPVRTHEAREMASYLMQAHTVLSNHFRMEEEIITALWDRANTYGY